MVFVMNIHGSTNRTTCEYIKRLVLILRLVNTLDDLYQSAVLDNPQLEEKLLPGMVIYQLTYSSLSMAST